MIAQEFDFWSPMLGGDATRISLSREGREYFAIVSHEDEREYGRLRREAVEKITEAMEAGCDPGEVAAVSERTGIRSFPHGPPAQRPNHGRLAPSIPAMPLLAHWVSDCLRPVLDGW